MTHIMAGVEDVREIFGRTPAAAPVRRCPTCGTESATFRPECPSCGKRFDRRAPWLSDRMRWALGTLVVVVVAGTCALVLPSVFDARDAGEADRARAQAALEETERRRLAAEQRPVRGRISGDVRARAAMTSAVESAILADARRRVAAKRLDGPITDARCSPLVRGTDPYAGRLGRFDCVAVKRPIIQDGKEVASLGHPYVATIDWNRGTWVFCKDNKVPGERGKPLAKVPLDAACVGAEGAERLGDGYLSPES
jgi:ferredoxin